MSRAAAIGGFVASGFESVAAEFERNFAERGELGAAFAAEFGGEAIVDLWGGVADRRSGRRWDADTLQPVFSGTKGFVAICMLLLLERGKLDLHAPVCRYWPEFAAAGKDAVLVRDVVSHTTGLPGLDTPVTWHEATDDRRMAELLAAQALSEDPRAVRSYHSLTFGWLCGELVRRVDGRSVGTFFAEEVARPLGLEAWIGLPDAEQHRVSTVELSGGWGEAPLFRQDEIERDPLLRSIYANPARYDSGDLPSNRPEWRTAEVPGLNGVATARSIARLYGHLDELLSGEMLSVAREPLSVRLDGISNSPAAFGIGFALQTSEHRLGPPDDAFGHAGAGGSLHGCWPTEGVGFSYAMNLLRDDLEDPRGVSLMRALYRAVRGCF